MSFPVERQKLLDPVLKDLSQISDVEEVQQDDFDSQSINVFVFLKVQSRSGCMTSSVRPWRFTGNIRTIKSEIKKVCEKHETSFHILDWPEKKYTRNGPGNVVDDGYDMEFIKIEIFA